MSQFVDAILGHAIGDAMGVPAEFKKRNYFKLNGIENMYVTGYDGVPIGSWSDDTSMEIATIQSFIDKRKFDYDDIMQNFLKWIDDAEFTASNFVFDVGSTCLKAIQEYARGKEAVKAGGISIYSNGNGSLMRILPVALYCHEAQLDDSEIIQLTNDISSLTHGHDISKLGCYIYVKYVIALLDGKSKEEAYDYIKNLLYLKYSPEAISVYKRILKQDISKLSEDEIRSSGYVVDSLEAALWCALTTNNYKDSILKAVNLGEDTDTIAAITGSMTGIIYDYDSFPMAWKRDLQRRDYLIELANKFEEACKE